MAPGLLNLILKNKLKSFIYTSTCSTALWFTYDYTLTNDLMRSSCRDASTYGDQSLRSANAPTRHITVILNPVACKRKSKKLYTKWVEPMLHLAGIKVSLVETESANQAYDLMKIMSNCDGVAIVGGDGTVHEALNGLLSRPDCTKAARNFPIAIIPAGQNNSIARYIHQNGMKYRNQKEFMILSTMRLVHSKTQKFDVVKISPLEQAHTDTIIDKTAQDTSSPIYMLRDIRYGIYQDNFFKVSGYRSYQTYIKPLWLRIQRAFGSSKKYPPPQIESISYTKPCEGCSACYEKHLLRDNQVECEKATNSRRWWSIVSPAKSNEPTDAEKKQFELSRRVNPDCQKWVDVGDLEAVSDFRACMMGDKKVRLSLSRQREYSPSDVTEVQDIRLKLKPELDAQEPLSSQTNGEKENDSDEKKPVQYLVDGHPTLARSIDITALSEAITVFTGPYNFDVLESSKPRHQDRLKK